MSIDFQQIITAGEWAYRAWNSGSAEEQDEAMQNLKNVLLDAGISEEDLEGEEEE